MNVVLLTLFVSLVLVFMAVILFAWSYVKGEYQHVDRVALFPLEEDTVTKPKANTMGMGPRPVVNGESEV